MHFAIFVLIVVYVRMISEHIMCIFLKYEYLNVQIKCVSYRGLNDSYFCL